MKCKLSVAPLSHIFGRVEAPASMQHCLNRAFCMLLTLVFICSDLFLVRIVLHLSFQAFYGLLSSKWVLCIFEGHDMETLSCWKFDFILSLGESCPISKQLPHLFNIFLYQNIYQTFRTDISTIDLNFYDIQILETLSNIIVP